METKVVQKKVIFRVDASEDIGSGHAVRCQTLARELCDRGMECIFVCRDLKGNMIERFRHRGFNVMVLPQHQISTSRLLQSIPNGWELTG